MWGKNVGKISASVIVAVCAFLIGLAIAIAFNKFNVE
jgi:hypothetical protein